MISKIDELISKLASTKTEENLFNPYNQICKNHDISTAPGLRQGNLRIYLDKHLQNKTDEIWFIDTVDYFSTKISGVPLVEINNYAKVEKILGISEHFERANKNGIVNGVNHTITKIWDLIASQTKPVLIWNVFPFYAHNPKDIAIKRTPTDEEFINNKEFVHLLMDIYKPKNISSINQRTKEVLGLLNIKSKLLNL